MAEPTATTHVDSDVGDSHVGIEDVSRESVPDGRDIGTPEVANTPMKTGSAKEDYGAYYAGIVGKPTGREVWLWYLYDLCSYFIYTTLVPVLFPLIISQILKLPLEPSARVVNIKGISCGQKQMNLYEALTTRFISVSSSRFSPLEWTSLSWGLGLILAAPVLVTVSPFLDHGRQPLLIAGTAIATGAFFCLPTGFFKVTWIFPPYIALIVVASTVATASHTRQLSLMVRGFTGPNLQKSHFQLRRGVSGWLSLYATAAGSLGSAVMSAFTYHMLRNKDGRFVSLWVVSIFSGLKWLVGIPHIVNIKPGLAPTSPTTPIAHFLSILKYPHAIGAVIVAFISSFTITCTFTSTALYLLGQLCFTPVTILYIWLLYYLLPLFSLPLMQILQHAIKASGVKMYLLGFLLSLGTTGVGFYYKDRHWQRRQVFLFAAIQSTSVGLLHAFARVLLIDCSPHGKEAAFSAWYSWGRALGTCIGFAVASAIPGNIRTSYEVAFWTAMSGALILIYGSISDFGGALAARHVISTEEELGDSPDHSLDDDSHAEKEQEKTA